METCERCALELLPFFEAATGSDWTEAQNAYNKVNDLEGDADDLKS